jgi:hypothetical protein
MKKQSYKEHEDDEVFPPLSYKRALELTRELVIAHDFTDEEVYLFTELIGGIAYNYDRGMRDGVAVAVIAEAYTHTNHVSLSGDAFLFEWRKKFKPFLKGKL